MSEYRIVERKGEYRIQRRRKFLGMTWWSDVIEYYPDGAGYSTYSVYSLDAARKRLEELNAMGERDDTPWRVIE